MFNINAFCSSLTHFLLKFTLIFLVLTMKIYLVFLFHNFVFMIFQVKRHL